jgi:hypothetical protein
VQTVRLFQRGGKTTVHHSTQYHSAQHQHTCEKFGDGVGNHSTFALEKGHDHHPGGKRAFGVRLSNVDLFTKPEKFLDIPKSAVCSPKPLNEKTMSSRPTSEANAKPSVRSLRFFANGLRPSKRE